MGFKTGNTDMHLVVTDTLNQSVSGVTTICLMQCDTSSSHRDDQAIDCGLWNVVPLLFNGHQTFLDIGRNWKVNPEDPKHAH